MHTGASIGVCWPVPKPGLFAPGRKRGPRTPGPEGEARPGKLLVAQEPLCSPLFTASVRRGPARSGGTSVRPDLGMP